MKEIKLTRTFLSRPFSSVLILLCVVLLIEAISWSIASDIKEEQVNNVGGITSYIGILLRGIVLPELCTLFILVSLINRVHVWLRINSVLNEWSAILRYQVRFLPVMVFSFVLFYPVTQTVRYLLTEFPDYSMTEYWSGFIINTFIWSIYFKYLFPVLLIGYLAINVSLIIDASKQRRLINEANQAQITEAAQQIAALSATFVPKPVPVTPTPYLTHLKGKDATGEVSIPVNDAYYYTVEDRIYYAELVKGRFQISKTINELDKELDPGVFFRIKRDYIINRQAVQSFSYWENGKYIVRLNTADGYEIVVPRNRMNEFKDWLQLTLPTQTA